MPPSVGEHWNIGRHIIITGVGEIQVRQSAAVAVIGVVREGAVGNSSSK